MKVHGWTGLPDWLRPAPAWLKAAARQMLDEFGALIEAATAKRSRVLKDHPLQGGTRASRLAARRT